jgi:segregation and condensation protein A
MTYNIVLPQFEGPFDLLLFFIERDELDIYDIPIATVTNDFLNYLHSMETLNIDMASEFIVVAATLCRIKAKMLLPRKELDEEGNELDPRGELIQQLLEYKRYKGILDDLKELEDIRSKRKGRGNSTAELKVLAQKALVDAELESLSLFKLLQTFEKVVERFEDRQKIRVHKVVRYNYTLEEQKNFVRNLVLTRDKSDFKMIFSRCENRIHALFNFLAILELIQMEEIGVVVGEGINNFWVYKKEKDKLDPGGAE